MRTDIKAEELREALNRPIFRTTTDYANIFGAAFRYLALKEGDEEAVERVARVICRYDYADDDTHNFECRDLARAALAAAVETDL